MTGDSIAEDAAIAATALRDAYRRVPIAPLRNCFDERDRDTAYRIQAVNAAFWQGEGRAIVGRKVGLTAKSVQAQMGVDEPDYGTLFADMRVKDGGTLAASAVLQPRAEAEVAIVLARDLDDPDASPATILAAADHAVAAIEIVDSRIRDWDIRFFDTVADNGSSAYFVLGEERRALAGLDLYSCGMVMERNGAIVSLGAGAACLGHPLMAAAWLARTLARVGERMRAGDVILTGAMGPMVPVARGDRFTAHVGGLGSVGFACE